MRALAAYDFLSVQTFPEKIIHEEWRQTDHRCRDFAKLTALLAPLQMSLLLLCSLRYSKRANGPFTSEWRVKLIRMNVNERRIIYFCHCRVRSS